MECLTPIEILSVVCSLRNSLSKKRLYLTYFLLKSTITSKRPYTVVVRLASKKPDAVVLRLASKRPDTVFVLLASKRPNMVVVWLASKRPDTVVVQLASKRPDTVVVCLTFSIHGYHPAGVSEKTWLIPC